MTRVGDDERERRQPSTAHVWQESLQRHDPPEPSACQVPPKVQQGVVALYVAAGGGTCEARVWEPFGVRLPRLFRSPERVRDAAAANDALRAIAVDPLGGPRHERKVVGQAGVRD